MFCAACGEETPRETCTECGEPALLDGRYRLLEVLGQGGVGITWKATDTDGDTWAIKEMSLRRARSDKARQLIEREANVLGQLDHPAIPILHETVFSGRGKNRAIYLVQEFIDGVNLDEERRRKRYSVDEVLTIADELLFILAYLHELSPAVMHRDVKPANIMRRSDGTLVLIDFGSVRDALKDSVGGGSTVAGTFGYMAPEQLVGDATPAVDVYAVGATIAVLLTRKEPTEMLQRVGGLDFEPHVSAHPALVQFLKRMMHDDPAMRLRDAHRALDELQATREAMTRPATAIVYPTPPTTPGPALPAFIAMGTASVVALSMGVAFFILADSAPEPYPEVIELKAVPIAPQAPPPPPPPAARPEEVEGHPPTEPGPYPPLGNPETAVVAFHLFTDFQCPFCKRFEPTVAAVHEAYPDEVVIYFHDAPLPFHKEAFGAHEAARCANEQGAFHAMKDILFDNSRDLHRQNLGSYAKLAEVDLNPFENCMASGRYTEVIANAYNRATEYGIRGTPNSWIGSQKVTGAQPLDKVLEITATEIAKTSRK